MFHAGHVSVLQEAKQRGDYVIVGVYNDHIVNTLLGSNFPIMNLNERVLSVLGCKYVDDVLIDAPYIITKDMIQSMHIDVVLTEKSGAVNGGESMNTSDSSSVVDGGVPCLSDTHAVSPSSSQIMIDPYQIPRELNLLQQITRQSSSMSVYDIVRKVDQQKEKLSIKFLKKKRQEEAFYAQKYGNVI